MKKGGNARKTLKKNGKNSKKTKKTKNSKNTKKERKNNRFSRKIKMNKSIKKRGGALENKICTICHNELNEVTFPCGHSFHKDCITTWCNSQHQNGRNCSCPVCRDERVENVVNNGEEPNPNIQNNDEDEDEDEDYDPDDYDENGNYIPDDYDPEDYDFSR